MVSSQWRFRTGRRDHMDIASTSPPHHHTHLFSFLPTFSIAGGRNDNNKPQAAMAPWFAYAPT